MGEAMALVNWADWIRVFFAFLAAIMVGGSIMLYAAKKAGDKGIEQFKRDRSAREGLVEALAAELWAYDGDEYLTWAQALQDEADEIHFTRQAAKEILERLGIGEAHVRQVGTDA